MVVFLLTKGLFITRQPCMKPWPASPEIAVHLLVGLLVRLHLSFSQLLPCDFTLVDFGRLL